MTVSSANPPGELFSYPLLTTTAAELGNNAREVIQGQEKGVGFLLLSDLKNRKLNWPSSPDKLAAKQQNGCGNSWLQAKRLRLAKSRRNSGGVAALTGRSEKLPKQP